MTRINTKSHESTRISLGRLIRSYQAGQIDSQTFRDMIYGLNLLLGFFKLELEQDVERRLEAIEEQIAQGDRRR